VSDVQKSVFQQYLMIMHTISYILLSKVFLSRPTYNDAWILDMAYLSNIGANSGVVWGLSPTKNLNSPPRHS